MVKEQNWPNNIPSRPFSLNVFIIIIMFFSCSFIVAQSIWLEVSIGIKKGGNCYKFVFFIDVVASRIKFLNFGNS